MKRYRLIEKLTAMGCIQVRSKGPHDWYTNPSTKQSQPVPRHKEDQRLSGQVHHQEAIR
ncbi:MAG: type II toxin-antitoxin system HicA family toxin [Desulfobacteraceae bacterium]|nr:type II toxin-antitoxin system HicA family toxin [Desulfobacteraceae bacterium]MDD3993046.1 type II toxin-antitoxin system HicA family toxin [Desulfobacteraceae bacterium]